MTHCAKPYFFWLVKSESNPSRLASARRVNVTRCKYFDHLSGFLMRDVGLPHNAHRKLLSPRSLGAF
jgi:hypothetical protein